jgi:hypothetical protein
MSRWVPPVVSRAEQTVWWRACELLKSCMETKVEEGLQMARGCHHPDAQWLASLFPDGTALTAERLREGMLAQGDDPRALYFACEFEDHDPDSDDEDGEFHYDERDLPMLTRAAEMRYAPAQAWLATRFHEAEDEELAFQFAQSAAAQGDRRGVYLLALCYRWGRGCIQDRNRAKELFKEAVVLGYFAAPYFYGKMTFRRLHWERFLWWGISADGRFKDEPFRDAVLAMLPLFEKGEHGRILHTVAPVIRKNLNVEESMLFLQTIEWCERVKFERVLALHEAMLGRARRGIDCWSMIGRRHRVVKDIRVMIAKMVWKKAWLWGENTDDVVLRKKLKRAEQRGEVIV